jgi:hypothetical protein
LMTRETMKVFCMSQCLQERDPSFQLVAGQQI